MYKLHYMQACSGRGPLTSSTSTRSRHSRKGWTLPLSLLLREHIKQRHPVEPTSLDKLDFKYGLTGWAYLPPQTHPGPQTPGLRPGSRGGRARPSWSGPRGSARPNPGNRGVVRAISGARQIFHRTKQFPFPGIGDCPDRPPGLCPPRPKARSPGRVEPPGSLEIVRHLTVTRFRFITTSSE